MSDYIKQLEERIELLQSELSQYETNEILKIPTMSRTTPGIHFNDRIDVMLHANFAILCEFIEKEWDGKCEQYTKDDLAGQAVDEQDFIYMEQRNKDHKELFDLYLWWINDYEKLYGNSVDFYDKEQEKLERLIYLRKYLWT